MNNHSVTRASPSLLCLALRGSLFQLLGFQPGRVLEEVHIDVLLGYLDVAYDRATNEAVSDRYLAHVSPHAHTYTYTLYTIVRNLNNTATAYEVRVLLCVLYFDVAELEVQKLIHRHEGWGREGGEPATNTGTRQTACRLG